MTKPGINLQDSFLNQVRKDNAQIDLVLLNGGRLTGQVRGFDNFTVIVQSGPDQHLIYKHAIAQIIHQRSSYRPAEREMHGHGPQGDEGRPSGARPPRPPRPANEPPAAGDRPQAEPDRVAEKPAEKIAEKPASEPVRAEQRPAAPAERAEKPPIQHERTERPAAQAERKERPERGDGNRGEKSKFNTIDLKDLKID